MRPVGRPDPAPSRVQYRLQRLMLTPVFRFAIRVGLPALLVAGGVAGWLSVPQNRDAVAGHVADLRAAVEARPEFQVTHLAIDGASPAVAEAVRATLALDLPESSLVLDLPVLQASVVALDPVKSAVLRVRQGGVLQAEIVERVPVVLYRAASGLVLLDAEGVRTGRAGARADHPGLPVVTGAGASDAVAEALALYAAIGPLHARLRGFERKGERRWDVVLDDGQRIRLPAVQPVRALDQAVAMHEAEGVLAPPVAELDLRLPHRPTLRLIEDAARGLWEARMDTDGAGGGQE